MLFFVWVGTPSLYWEEPRLQDWGGQDQRPPGIFLDIRHPSFRFRGNTAIAETAGAVQGLQEAGPLTYSWAPGAARL